MEGLRMDGRLPHPKIHGFTILHTQSTIMGIVVGTTPCGVCGSPWPRPGSSASAGQDRSNTSGFDAVPFVPGASGMVRTHRLHVSQEPRG